MRGGTMFYYFRYYVDQAKLLAFLQNVGLPQATAAVPDGGHPLMNMLGLILNADRTNVASVGFSLFNIASQLTTVVGVVASAYLAMRFGKRAVARVGFTLATIFVASFILMPADTIGATYGLEMIRALSYAPTIPLIWAMFADVADYAEWKTERRATGVVFATILFALKTGLSIGGFLAGWLLDGFGYRPNVDQTANALLGIRITASVVPSVFLAIVVICMFRYGITREIETQIGAELDERRRGVRGGPSPAGIGGANVAVAK
jgi:Na+/melibiose symporter-like transporter